MLILTWAWTGYLAHHLVEIEASRFLSRWEFFEALEPLRDQCHSAIVHIGHVSDLELRQVIQGTSEQEFREILRLAQLLRNPLFQLYNQ